MEVGEPRLFWNNPSMDAKLVSIIIPTHNRPGWLTDAIKSSVIQSYHPIEIIVVDDGSELGMNKHLIEQFPAARYIYQKNSGLGSARNTGLAKSQGNFIQFLDDDDWLSPDAVREKMAVFDSNPGLGVVYSDLYLTDESGTVTSRYFERFKRPLPAGDVYAVLIERNFIPIHAILWKRDILEKVGGFPARSGHEDWECLIRASEISLFSALDAPLGYYRQHVRSMARTNDVMYRGKLAFQADIASSKRFSQLPSAQRTRLLTRYAFQQWAFGDPDMAAHFLSQAREGVLHHNFLQLRHPTNVGTLLSRFHGICPISHQN